MRLNPDCIRDLLFSIEEESTSCSIISSKNLSNAEKLKKYSEEEIQAFKEKYEVHDLPVLNELYEKRL